jgi:hypothetical protein
MESLEPAMLDPPPRGVHPGFLLPPLPMHDAAARRRGGPEAGEPTVVRLPLGMCRAATGWHNSCRSAPPIDRPRPERPLA